jgi:hypothetical protein
MKEMEIGHSQRLSSRLLCANRDRFSSPVEKEIFLGVMSELFHFGNGQSGYGAAAARPFKLRHP